MSQRLKDVASRIEDPAGTTTSEALAASLLSKPSV